MHKIWWIVAILAIVTSLPAHAIDRAFKPAARPGVTPSAITDPLKITYRVSGIRDNGAAINTGVATSFHCTNWSTVSEKIRIVVMKFDGSVSSDNTFTLTPNRTWTASTHGTVAFNEDAFLSEGTVIDQGSARILSTSPKLICSVMMLDASVATPNGIALHLVRFNAFNRTEE